MKNTIMISIFETAATLPNIEGVAAINQLLIEASTKHEGVVPAGFSYGQTITSGEPHNDYAFHAKIADPWPLESKIFCGIGATPQKAFENLEANIAEWFAPSDAFLSETGQTDLRTEYATAS